MLAKSLVKWSVLMCLILTSYSWAEVLWSADFEPPAYIDDALTRQQGWWEYNNRPQGAVSDFGDGWRARLGGWNGYDHLVLTPWIDNELSTDVNFQISLIIKPGAGSSPCLIRVLDNGQWSVINVTFDQASGHILAKGGDDAEWIDTGFAYTAEADHQLQIDRNDGNQTFSIKVNGTLVLQNATEGMHHDGLGYIYILGGGNGGAGSASNFTYLDNVVVSVPPPAQAPVFNISDRNTVVITCATAGATIRYTTDGTEPSETNGLTINSGDSVTVDNMEILKAKAFAQEYVGSATQSMVYYPDMLWSADFEPPAYVDDTLTGQQGWWEYHNWPNGVASDFGDSWRARLGGWNGYDHLVLTPWIDNELSTDVNFQISLIVKPGAGSSPCLIRVLDNGQRSVVNVIFDQASGHILAKGGDDAEWIDTGFAYTAEADHQLQIDRNDGNQTFSIKVNGTLVLQNAPEGTHHDGLGYIYILGGGNGGAGGASNFTYLDDIVVSAPLATQAPAFNPSYAMISGPKAVKITCATEGATIRYTTDGTEPNETNGEIITSSNSVTVNIGTTLKAKAWAQNKIPSVTTSVTYTAPASYNRPSKIGQGSAVTLDGQLADWSDTPWTSLDQVYDSYYESIPALNADIPEAYYAAKWTADKVYVAIKVRDTHHIFTGSYTAWDGRDAVEVYLHAKSGTHGMPEYSQQYTIGLTGETTNQVWTSMTNTGFVPSVANFQASGKVVGQWLIYEVAMSPFLFFSGESQGSIPATLELGDVLGLDVCVVGNDGQAAAPMGYSVGYTGMKCENTMAGKVWDWNLFGIHQLVAIVHPGDANLDNMVDVGDLGILAANYGSTSKAWAQGDFNGDLLVDVGDLGILAAHYGEGSTNSSSADFNADYAKAFSTTVTDDIENDTTLGNSMCSALGLPLIAGLMLAYMMLLGNFKLED
jgi:hypothetical protein